jgi:hypothetical protein
MKLKILALGYAAAILAAACMLVLSILANMGIYVEAATQMMMVHMFYDITIVGTITGMIEAAIVAFIAAIVFGWLYNMFAEK